MDSGRFARINSSIVHYVSLQVVPDELNLLAFIIFGHRFHHFLLGDRCNARPHHVSHCATDDFQNEDSNQKRAEL